MHRPNFAHQAQQIAHQHMVQAQQKRQHDGGHYVYEQIARRKAAERNARLTRRPDEIRPRTNSTAVMVGMMSSLLS